MTLYICKYINSLLITTTHTHKKKKKKRDKTNQKKKEKKVKSIGHVEKCTISPSLFGEIE